MPFSTRSEITLDLADPAQSGFVFLPLEVVRQLQRTKIRQLRMGDEEVEWVSKEVSLGIAKPCDPNAFVGYSAGILRNQGLFVSRPV